MAYKVSSGPDFRSAVFACQPEICHSGERSDVGNPSFAVAIRLQTPAKPLPVERRKQNLSFRKKHIPCRMAGDAECASRMPLLLRRGAEGSKAERSVLTPPGFAALCHPPRRGGLFYLSVSFADSSPERRAKGQRGRIQFAPTGRRQDLWQSYPPGTVGEGCSHPHASPFKERCRTQ